MQDLIHEPVELIDEDLDAVAGGLSIDLNIADTDQYIKQVQIHGLFNSQIAINISDIMQRS